jgi:hypothetical protein
LKKFLILVTAAILNGGRSEQKVTTLDKDLAWNIYADGHLGFSIGPKSNNTWLAACNDHS